MSTNPAVPAFDLYLWEGSGDFAARIEKAFAGLPVTLIPVDRQQDGLHRSSRQPAVALVSVSVMVDERFKALDWLSAQAIPVIWVAAARSYRDQNSQFFPPAHSYTLAAQFSSAELRGMVLKLVSAMCPEPIAQEPVAADDDFIVVSESMRELLSEAGAIADSTCNVLIYGETGVGKERVARYVHDHSGRVGGAFVAVNCGAVPDGLFEAEFFGYARGAFTGAISSHKGYFEQANGGTLFLDEVGELPPHQQVKLLRVLESRRATRLGSTAEVALDFRLIAATNRDLLEAVRAGSFRADLYFRLAVIEFHIPSLDARGRAEKIKIFEILMTRHLASQSIREVKLPEWLTEQVGSMRFSGNVREMLNLVERLGVVRVTWGQWDANRIGQVFNRMQRLTLPEGRSEQESDDTLASFSPSEQAERMRVIAALEAHDWRRQETAAALGISRKVLWEKMRKLHIRSGREAAQPVAAGWVAA